MEARHVFVWTGGQPQGASDSELLAQTLPALPVPTPLRRAARVDYRWGETAFEVAAIACSLRVTAWGDRQVSWLHCKAMRTAEVKAEGPTGMMTVLAPTPYVIGIRPGATFHLGQSRPARDLGVFPPNQSAPAGALPLAEIERAVVELWSPERN